MSSTAGLCPNSHIMVRWTDSEFEGMYTCNMCRSVSEEHSAGLECKGCRFNKCLSCVGAKLQAKCPKGHPLALMKLGADASCDNCSIPNACPAQLVCRECDYVFCDRCVFLEATKALPPTHSPSEFSGVIVPPVKPNYSDPTEFDDQEMTAAPLPAGLYWYKSRAQTRSQGGYFATDFECSWLLQRPTRQIYFQDGLLADVTAVAGFTFEISQASLVPNGADIYFTLPEWFPSAADAPTEMAQFAPFPAEYLAGKDGFGIDNTGYGDNGYADGGNAHLYLWKERMVDRSALANFKIIISNIAVCALSVLALWINFVICENIGESARHWAFIFLWLFLGNLAYVTVYTFICFVLLRYVGGEERHNPILKTVGLCLLLFVFSCSFGAPIAWTQAQQTTANRYLEVSKTKTLNCWRNPNERFDMINDHFIVFEEADWIVDYKLRYNQGVSTLMGTGDDDKDDGKRYNFCLAPMSYRGLPNCPQNFYAACYRETSMSYLASCDDNDARTCGWDLPASGNLIRTMNHNEQFWSSAEEEDETYWQLALGFATPSNSATPVTNLIGFYSGEGPTEINAYLDKAKTIQRALLISSLVSFGGLMLLALLCLLKCGGEDDYVFWDETDWA